VSRPLTIALTFDLDPDVFDESISPTEARTKISWRGVSEGIPMIRERLAALGADCGVEPKPSWFVRVDNQIEAIWGRPGYLLEAYADLFRTIEAAGEEIAWHPHLYRRTDAGWAQETDPAALTKAMERALEDMRALGYAPRTGRIGEAYGADALMAAFDQLGVAYDSTAMAGRKRVDAERTIDWEETPHRAYRPSCADHRIPGAPSRNVIELPMSMLKVRADYDSEPFLRYLDLSFHPRAVQPGLEALIASADYLITVTHPSAFLAGLAPPGGHGLVAFDIAALEANFRAILDAAARCGRPVRFSTISALGDECAALMGEVRP